MNLTFRAARILLMSSLLVFTGVINGAASMPKASAEEETLVKPIPFSSLEDVRIGNAQDDKAKTGVTVICFPKGAKTGVDISGGGPASRETPVLDPIKENIGIHAIVFSGGSAFTDSAAELVPHCQTVRPVQPDKYHHRRHYNEREL